MPASLPPPGGQPATASDDAPGQAASPAPGLGDGVTAGMLPSMALPMLALQDMQPTAVAPSAEASVPPAADPAGQLSPALVSLARGTDGRDEITVSMHPRDLGEVQVRLVRADDGTTTITVTASQPETLQNLVQNAHHLHAALDAANIPAENRVMTFAVASNEPGTAPGQGGPGGTATDAGGGSGRQPGDGQGRQATGGSAGSQHGAAPNQTYAATTPVASRRTWQVSGLNITA